MSRVKVCGKYQNFKSRFNFVKIEFLFNLSFSLSFSIVMELADGGDVFQKILNHKK